VIGEILLRTAESVYEQESRAFTIDLDRQADAIICRDAHRRHAHAFLPGGAT